MVADAGEAGESWSYSEQIQKSSYAMINSMAANPLEGQFKLCTRG